MREQPNYPFDMTGYTCFSIINCPAEQAIQLLKEYPDICAAEDRVPFSFQIVSLPEETKWTLLRWPQPGRFYDLMNLTMWLMGYRAGLGGENPIFVALPPAERAVEGPFLASPTTITSSAIPCWASGKTGALIIPYQGKHCAGSVKACSPKSIFSTAAAIPPPVFSWNG